MGDMHSMLKLTETLDSEETTGRFHNNVVNIKAFRKRNIPYIFIWILYYAWVIAFTTWWTASPVTETVFSTGLRSLIHSINLLSSAVFIFIIRKEWFVITSRVGALLIIIGMILFLLIPKNSFQLASVIAIGITLGIVNISILMPFVFTLNNTEKFYSVILSNVVINLVMMFQYSSPGSATQLGGGEQLLTLILLVIPLSATIFFKKNSITHDDYPADIHELKPKFYLTLVYTCSVAVLCKGAGKGVLDIAAGLHGTLIYQWYYLGGLLGCMIFIAVYALTEKAVIWLNNILFSSIAMGLLCNAFTAEVPGMAYVFAIFLGIGCTIGMINMYYILAVVGKKYNSMQYLRLSILFIGICGGVSGVMIGNLINKINTYQISIIASVIAAAFMLIFLMLSPFLAQAQYFEDWTKDSGKMEIEDNLDIFHRYNLSKREAEVCKLLLEGYTLRQVSAILSIAYSTVNTYCTAIYRKLNINSRTELIMLFKDYVK
jgi:DNA-binding CsgD family transcriptional regulator